MKLVRPITRAGKSRVVSVSRVLPTALASHPTMVAAEQQSRAVRTAVALSLSALTGAALLVGLIAHESDYGRSIASVVPAPTFPTSAPGAAPGAVSVALLADDAAGRVVSIAPVQVCEHADQPAEADKCSSAVKVTKIYPTFQDPMPEEAPLNKANQRP